ncbi:hypothetical protein CC80DRAFT_544901 [Byssothecium circinans]|uniref:Uncharacterized protein n=1 Tax=Byssothecium circinans TaxID=147558 RepID=A0A6A5U6Y3_9PLEO|nr:hypothetical protein CC80DRAFT_544901 [Byssothecium circinans]
MNHLKDQHRVPESIEGFMSTPPSRSCRHVGCHLVASRTLKNCAELRGAISLEDSLLQECRLEVVEWLRGRQGVTQARPNCLATASYVASSLGASFTKFRWRGLLIRIYRFGTPEEKAKRLRALIAPFLHRSYIHLIESTTPKFHTAAWD